FTFVESAPLAVDNEPLVMLGWDPPGADGFLHVSLTTQAGEQFSLHKPGAVLRGGWIWVLESFTDQGKATAVVRRFRPSAAPRAVLVGQPIEATTGDVLTTRLGARFRVGTIVVHNRDVWSMEITTEHGSEAPTTTTFDVQRAPQPGHLLTPDHRV